MEETKPKKEHKYLVPLLVTLLVVILLSVVGYGVYYYYNNMTKEPVVQPTVKTDTRTTEQKELDAVDKDLQDDTLNTTDTDADVKELESIDISGV